LELAQQLLARGTLRYADGSWILPPEIVDPPPTDIVEALLLRLTPLGQEARALAELLSVRRRGASAEQLLALCASNSADTTFRALEELVSAGILEGAGDEYSFVQDALRAQLAHSLASERSRELHARWAEHLLSQPRVDQSTELEAGWHLVHTRSELQGAGLLARVAPRLIDQRVNMDAAVPALERALEVYERHNVDLAERLRLRALLVLSSYLFDFRLANRHATPLLDALYPFTGLIQVQRCGRWLGKRAGFVLGVTWAALRRSLQPRDRRGPRVMDALLYYARGTMGLLGLRALAVDVEGVHAVLQRMTGFEHSPLRALSLVHRVARAIHLHGRGYGAEVHRAIDSAHQELRRIRPWRVSDQEHRDLMIGLLLLQGINETGRERSRSLECAASLERIATPLAIASSLRIRMTYYLLRGDLTQAQQYRRQLDLKAIESGSHWQVEWMALPLEWLASALWADLIGLRQALERFERFAHEAAGPVSVRRFLLQPYHFRRGEYAKAAEVGELYMQTYAPRTRIGWEVVYALSALAYVEIGEAQRALEICEAALAHIGDEDREYFMMCVPLETAHATALAYTGEATRSQALFRARVSRLRASGDLTYAILLHEYRIKVARRLGDQAALDEAVADLRDAALTSRNASVIALANRLAQQASPRGARIPMPMEALHDLIACTHTDGGHALQALAVIGQYADCQEAYLFVRAEHSLQLAASLDEVTPPEGLVQKLCALPPANDADVPALLDSGYCAYRLQSGFAVLRSEEGAAANVPAALLQEAERGLQSRAS
jgi:tetratricopeptide (TPR) repeat protein